MRSKAEFRVITRPAPLRKPPHRRYLRNFMIPNLDDTIVAHASAAGAGQRAIVRLSGPAVSKIIASVFDAPPEQPQTHRSLCHGRLQFAGIHSPLPADLHFAPAPHLYWAGYRRISFRILPAVDRRSDRRSLERGRRAAQPGEFTLRAFLNGKKDLPQAEAVNAVIEAGSPDELQRTTSATGRRSRPTSARLARRSAQFARRRRSGTRFCRRRHPVRRSQAASAAVGQGDGTSSQICASNWRAARSAAGPFAWP